MCHFGSKISHSHLPVTLASLFSCLHIWFPHGNLKSVETGWVILDGEDVVFNWEKVSVAWEEAGKMERLLEISRIFESCEQICKWYLEGSASRRFQCNFPPNSSKLYVFWIIILTTIEHNRDLCVHYVELSLEPGDQVRPWEESIFCKRVVLRSMGWMFMCLNIVKSIL